MKKNRKVEISVSILNMDFSQLATELKLVEEAGIDSFHMDIMDGNFVDNISFGPDIVAAVRRNTQLPLHTHLMITRPEKFADSFLKAGSDSLTFHLETMNPEREKLLDRPAMGLSLNPDIDIEGIFPFSDRISQVLIMSVFAGFGGQKFIPDVLEKIRKIRDFRDKNGKSFRIGVDGGINPETASLCAAAGADELIVGSYITSSPDPAGAVKSIREAIS
ncbi:MAG: ribulose-phosphate 3-epimerase [Elusimicrobia bacterium]|nr:ribulose-phosphate 3-epimerase [Elusimicrobiota bacterium]